MIYKELDSIYRCYNARDKEVEWNFSSMSWKVIVFDSFWITIPLSTIASEEGNRVEFVDSSETEMILYLISVLGY